ncbi:MAG: RNA polymerase sigma-70 factor [Bacteroidetes bacterium]|nr:RNA polymerase sigma-70 factor [Bacteroidota bacterium]
MQLNEQQYWQLISEGDKNVFENVFRTYYQPLCNYACSVIKDIDESEEVVQNLFYNICAKRETIQVTGSLKSYLYRAVHNDCLNKIKHIKVRTQYADDYKNNMNGSFDDASKTLQAKELGKQINEALDALPEQCGIVFKLSRFENLKYSEIAEQLNISVKTVENHMGKALKILREKLKDHLPAVFWLYINFWI